MATLRVTNLKGRTANVAPDLPDGANITGVATAGTVVVGTALTLADNIKSYWGTGGDLTVYHDASNSIISNTTGELLIDSDTMNIRSTTGGESYVYGSVGAGVTLFHDNTQKFTTTSGGVQVSGNAVATSKFRGNDGVKLSLGDSEDLQIQHDGNNAIIDSTTGHTYIRNTDAQFIFQPKMDENSLILKPDGAVEAYHDNSKRLETTSSGITVTGTVSDSLGTLRSLPVNSQTSAYSLVAADAGKLIKITTGGVTCPNGESFSAGDMISIMNESGSDQTITQGGGATLYWTADGTTGNRTLGARGVATIVMAGSSAFYISGSGLS